MKGNIIKIMPAIIGTALIASILAGCSRGFSSGGQAPPPPAPTASKPATATTTPGLTGGPTSKSTVLYSPKTVTPQISNGIVTLSASKMVSDGIELFSVPSDTGSMPFMAYQLDGQYYVRAAVCVPCGSKSFSLQNGILICGACRTQFNATTGVGVKGVSACMSYAKKAASYTLDGDNLKINAADLKTAYQNTMNRR